MEAVVDGIAYWRKWRRCCTCKAAKHCDMVLRSWLVLLGLQGSCRWRHPGRRRRWPVQWTHQQQRWDSEEAVTADALTHTTSPQSTLVGIELEPIEAHPARTWKYCRRKQKYRSTEWI